MDERLILVTNDDGYASKGIGAAIAVARRFGRVVVVAPETAQSGMSQAITMPHASQRGGYRIQIAATGEATKPRSAE